MINKNNILSSLIVEKLQSTKVGLLIKSIDDIDPVTIISSVCNNQSVNELFVSCIGYGDLSVNVAKCCFSTSVESSVEWRSNPKYAGKIITFVKDDSPKLHSLSDFDTINNIDLSRSLIVLQINKAENKPTIEFWKVLTCDELKGIYSYSMLQEFINALENESSDIGDNLWILNLLPDRNVLSGDIKSRLIDNHKHIIEIGQLSEESRKRLSRSLMNVEDDEKEELQCAYNNLQSYFKYGQKNTLKELSYELVRRLLTAAKKTQKTPKQGDETDPTPNTTKQISPKELDTLISDSLVNGDQNDEQDLQDLVNNLNDHYDDTESDSSTISGVGGKFEERTINLGKHNEDLRKLVGKVCSDDNWGGLITTEETVLKDIISSDDIQYELFSPKSKECRLISFDKASLFEFIERFDKFITDSDITFHDILTNLILYRNQLLKKIDMIMYHPILAFGVDLGLRESMINYIESWGKLYKHFCDNIDKMQKNSPDGTEYIAKSLLILDIIFIKTPTEWKAILSPMHTMYLWRYYELFKNFANNREQLSDKDKSVLTKVLTKLPNVLNYVVVNKIIISEGDEVTLPCSGSIDMLPSFENKTNRYLGDDGIESITEILERWIAYAPYSKKEIRICVVDVPNLVVVIREIKKFLDNSKCNRIVIDVYDTRSQNGNTELAKLDFMNQDSLIGKDIKEDKIQISILNLASIDDVKNKIKEHPVHVAFFFDQYKYSLSSVSSTQNLYINPLVVSYDYSFDTVTGKGKLYPSTNSESGIIGDYHKLLRAAHVIDSTKCPSVVQTKTEHIQKVAETLSQNYTQWLVVIDRDTSNYAPENSIPIGEIQTEKRNVSIWTSNNSRIINRYESLLRDYNLTPDRNRLIEIMSKFGHIGSAGLISMPKQGFNKQVTDSKMKGLLGTLFASVWYTDSYENSLIASLDGSISRTWLHNDETENNRADLVGLYYTEENNTLHVQSIEVKTRDENPDATYDSEHIIKGHAADQISSVIRTLSDIFSEDESNVTDMFVSARREVLKYQIVSECFMSIHEREWQQKWTDILKKAFNQRNRNINIEVSGILVFINLSSTENGKTVSCKFNDGIEEYPIDFVQLNSTDVQELIFGTPKDDLKTQEVAQIVTEQIVTEQIVTEQIAVEQIAAEPEIKPENIHSGILDSNQTSPLEDDFKDISSRVDSSLNNEDDKHPSIISETLDNSSKDVRVQEAISNLVSDFIRSCQTYNINLQECELKNVIVGPSIIRIPFKLKRGQSINRLLNNLPDISREIRRSDALIQQPKNTDEIYLDIPRTHPDPVLYCDVVDKISAECSPEKLYFPLGRTPDGKDIIKDLSEMPHLLVGGSTGSGKTVFLFTLIMSLLKSHSNKEDLQLILSSSKEEDFSLLRSIPHLYEGKIISDAQEAIQIITEVVASESEKRMNLLTEAHVPNISQYNEISENKMRPLVVIIDEFADLADQLGSNAQKEEFYRPVRRIAQTGRSRGIHLVLCTQRPDAKLVPSGIKAQLNGRIALRVNDAIASRMIIDENGAEHLQKHGDIIFKNADEMERCQGYYITPQEIEEIINSIVHQQ